jgi:hypothetical protein
MNRILELLIALVLVAVIAVVVGLVLPSHQHVSHATETNRPLPVVFDMLNGFKRFKDWNALHNLDPKTKFSLSAAESGKGAQVDYSSNIPQIGDGSWQVAESVPGEKIVYHLENGDYGSDKTMTFRFRRVGNQKLSVEITESYDVDYGFNLFGRYAGLYVSRSVGDTMKTSLANLNALLATIPKFDYTQLSVPPKVVAVPAENLLVAPTTAKRANDLVQSAMTTQEKWLRQVIEHNGLEAAGPLRIITTNFGAETYEFDVAIPVRKIGQAATNPLPSLDVKMVGDEAKWVHYVQTKPSNAITSSYTGHMAQLPTIRESMKGWGVTHGEDVGDRPYESYTKGIATSFTDGGEFTLFWPVKAPGSK